MDTTPINYRIPAIKKSLIDTEFFIDINEVFFDIETQKLYIRNASKDIIDLESGTEITKENGLYYVILGNEKYLIDIQSDSSVTGIELPLGKMLLSFTVDNGQTTSSLVSTTLLNRTVTITGNSLGVPVSEFSSFEYKLYDYINGSRHLLRSGTFPTGSTTLAVSEKALKHLSIEVRGFHANLNVWNEWSDIVNNSGFDLDLLNLIPVNTTELVAMNKKNGDSFTTDQTYNITLGSSSHNISPLFVDTDIFDKTNFIQWAIDGIEIRDSVTNELYPNAYSLKIVADNTNTTLPYYNALTNTDIVNNFYMFKTLRNYLLAGVPFKLSFVNYKELKPDGSRYSWQIKARLTYKYLTVGGSLALRTNFFPLCDLLVGVDEEPDLTSLQLVGMDSSTVYEEGSVLSNISFTHSMPMDPTNPYVLEVLNNIELVARTPNIITYEPYQNMETLIETVLDPITNKEVAKVYSVSNSLNTSNASHFSLILGSMSRETTDTLGNPYFDACTAIHVYIKTANGFTSHLLNPKNSFDNGTATTVNAVTKEVSMTSTVGGNTVIATFERNSSTNTELQTLTFPNIQTAGIEEIYIDVGYSATSMWTSNSVFSKKGVTQKFLLPNLI